MFENFENASTKEREDMIDETTRQVHLARQFIRFDKALKICTNDAMRKRLEEYKRQTLKLMENC